MRSASFDFVCECRGVVSFPACGPRRSPSHRMRRDPGAFLQVTGSLRRWQTDKRSFETCLACISDDLRRDVSFSAEFVLMLGPMISCLSVSRPVNSNPMISNPVTSLR